MMQITQQMQGPKLQITVLLFKAICKYLIEHGVPYILSERLSQGDVENYFGRQCAIGRRFDNPTVQHFGYNDNTIKLQYSVRSVAGNIWGFTSIVTEPLPKSFYSIIFNWNSLYSKLNSHCKAWCY